MLASVEISMYPLQVEYKAHIIAFIQSLKNNSQLKLVTNPLSTQVYGELSLILSMLGTSMENAWTTGGKAAFVVKFLAGDLSPEDGKYILEFN